MAKTLEQAILDGTLQYTSNSVKNYTKIALNVPLATPSLLEDVHLMIDKEIRGGLHRVEYKSLLIEDSYRGIFSSRREIGMLAHVKYEDDGSDCFKYFQLKTGTGSNLSDWEEVGSGANLTINNPLTVATLTDRDNLTGVTSNDFVNVADARTEDEILEDAGIYSASYIWDGTQWLRVYSFGNDPNSHARNNDTQIVTEGGQVVTAIEIINLKNNVVLQSQINDLNTTGHTAELYSSSKINELLEDKITKPDPSTWAANPEEMFLAQDGNYYIIKTSAGMIGSIDGGDASSIY